MYTLRIISGNEVNRNLIITNEELGDSYSVIYKVQEKDEKYDKNNDVFEDAFDSYFEKGFKNEKERSEIMKNIKAFILPSKHDKHDERDYASCYPINKSDKVYIMTEDGSTFERL